MQAQVILEVLEEVAVLLEAAEHRAKEIMEETLKAAVVELAQRALVFLAALFQLAVLVAQAVLGLHLQLRVHQYFMQAAVEARETREVSPQAQEAMEAVAQDLRSQELMLLLAQQTQAAAEVRHLMGMGERKAIAAQAVLVL